MLPVNGISSRHLFGNCGVLSILEMGILLLLSFGCMNWSMSAQAEVLPSRSSSSRHRLLSTGNNFEQVYPQCGEDDESKTWPLLNVFDVEWYGAVGDGITDDTKAFAAAWMDACAASGSAVLMIPYNKTYLVNHLEFKGPCGNSLVVELAGILMAPSNPSLWNTSHSNTWLHFSHMNELTVEGGGTLDGRGQEWWDRSCKRNKKNKCQDAPTVLRFSAVSNLMVRDLLSINSPQIHIKLANCYDVQIVNVRVDAPGDSPNTDGIHVSGTQRALIRDSWIGTGDDCVSIVSGSADVRIRNIYCGPGHGISIGSLGKGGSDEYVSLVSVDGAILTGTTNGVRIKTWQGGAGSAIHVIFQNIQMNNVSHPIIIDQKYCDSSSSCVANETSAVHVSGVWYRNISGTSATKQAIKLECSAAAPCKNLVFDNISLVREAGQGDTTTLCENARGHVVGTIVPNMDCLSQAEEAVLQKLLQVTKQGAHLLQ